MRPPARGRDHLHRAALVPVLPRRPGAQGRGHAGQRRARADGGPRALRPRRPRARPRPGRRSQLRHARWDLRPEARRERAGDRRQGLQPQPQPDRDGQAGAPGQAHDRGDHQRQRSQGRGHALSRARLARYQGRDDHRGRHPPARHRRHAAATARGRGPRHRRRPGRPRAGLVGRRARRPAAARSHGAHGGRDRRRRPLAPRRVDRPADRGRPPGDLAQCDARPPRTGLRRARGQRGPPAALHRRRLARAAHAAGLDPRLCGAVPHGRGAPAGRRREGDGAHRGRGRAHGRARRGSADPRAPRRGARHAARAARPGRAGPRRRRRRARRGPGPRDRHRGRRSGAGRRRSRPAAPGPGQPAAQRVRPHARGDPDRGEPGPRGRRGAPRGPRPRPGPAHQRRRGAVRALLALGGAGASAGGAAPASAWPSWRRSSTPTTATCARATRPTAAPCSWSRCRPPPERPLPGASQAPPTVVPRRPPTLWP